jgi:hypothetical protein
MTDGIAANQTAQHPLMLRITDGNLTATLGTYQFEAQTVQLAANATNYIFLDLSQEPPLLTVNQSGFPASAVWTIATAITNDTKITSLTDSRPAFNNLAFGGGGTPGGSNTQIQYNNAGAFAGDSNLTWDAVNGALTVTGQGNPDTEIALQTDITATNGIFLSTSGATVLIVSSGQMEVSSQGEVDFISDANINFSAGTIVSFVSNAATAKYEFSNIPVFANNAAAIAGGLSAGMIYRTGANPDPVCIVN